MTFINHSNFENATKCLNKSWWYLLIIKTYILFYTQTQGFLKYLCTFSMEENKRLLTRSGYCQRCACVVCMTSAISWPNCVFAVARILGVRLKCERLDISNAFEEVDLVFTYPYSQFSTHWHAPPRFWLTGHKAPNSCSGKQVCMWMVCAYVQCLFSAFNTHTVRYVFVVGTR